MKEDIKHKARRFIRDIGGVISFESVKRYLNSIGYEVLFYNSSERGDRLLKEMELSNYSLTVKAFTVRRNKEKYVFINIENQYKLCSIIHEAAHAILEHMKKDKHICNERIDELEAEAFTYAVLRCKNKIKLNSLV